MTGPGALRIEVRRAPGRPAAVAAALERPRAADALVGRTPEEAVALVPRLHAICGQAQAAAARAALAAAGHPLPEPPAAGERILLEAAQEHLWRVLRDWPTVLGLPAAEEPFQRWYRALAAAARAPLPGGRLEGLLAFVRDEVVPGGLDAARDRAGLARWAAGAPGLGPALVRALGDRPGPAPVFLGLAGRPPEGAWRDGGARPEQDGAPAETGPLARRQRHPAVADLLASGGAGLLSRLVARLLDLLEVARALYAGDTRVEVPAARLGPGEGTAWLETARGALLHRARLEGGRVAAYAIVAPTAWNFHPRGPFVRAAEAIAAADDAALHAELVRWVVAFDPCVPWRLDLAAA